MEEGPEEVRCQGDKCLAAQTHASGDEKLKALPLPTWLSARMRPPCSSAVSRAM